MARRRSHRVAPRGTADFSLRLHGRGRIIRLAARLPSVTSSGARHATGVLSLRHLGGGGASTERGGVQRGRVPGPEGCSRPMRAIHWVHADG